MWKVNRPRVGTYKLVDTAIRQSCNAALRCAKITGMMIRGPGGITYIFLALTVVFEQKQEEPYHNVNPTVTLTQI